MKNNLDFYRHEADSHNHQKFKVLRAKYGWEGEGKFWALNNIIARAEDCRLDLSKKYNKASVAIDLDFTLEEFEKFLEYLSSPDECNLLCEENTGIYTNGHLQESLEIVMNTREAAKRRRERKKPWGDDEGSVRRASRDIQEKSSNTTDNSSDRNHKVKEKKSKREESKGNPLLTVLGLDPDKEV